MKEYRFWGWENANVPPLKTMPIRNPLDAYDVLLGCWSAETCAPRLRDEWSPADPTVGQCSITAFLLQDLFGGEVYGVRLPDGATHCYNVVGEAAFDLTSEQFGTKTLDYSQGTAQSREEHFADQDKFARYLLLSKRFLSACIEKAVIEDTPAPLVHVDTDFDRETYRRFYRRGRIVAGAGLSAGVLLLGVGLALTMLWHDAFCYVVTVLGVFWLFFGVFLLAQIDKTARKGIATGVRSAADFYEDRMVLKTFANGEQTAVSKVEYKDVAYYRKNEEYVFIYLRDKQAFPVKAGGDVDEISALLDRRQVKRKR